MLKGSVQRNKEGFLDSELRRPQCDCWTQPKYLKRKFLQKTFKETLSLQILMDLAFACKSNTFQYSPMLAFEAKT